METVKLDVRKLQLLNDCLCQTLEALNQPINVTRRDQVGQANLLRTCETYSNMVSAV